MKIIVKESNIGKLNDAIKTAEGRAKARTITAEDIIKTADKITRNFTEFYGVPKKAILGVIADVDYNAQDFPNAYRYTPESTQFRMEYTPSGWAILSIERWETRRAKCAVKLELTEDAKEAITRRASVMYAHEI